MENSDIFEKDQKYIVHTYNRFPAAIKKGHGAQAEDFEGKRHRRVMICFHERKMGIV